MVVVHKCGQDMATIFLIGNGLGMACFPEIFSLETSMHDSYHDLDRDERVELRNIIAPKREPLSENDLRDLQRILWYLDETGADSHLLDISGKFLFGVVQRFFDVNSDVIKDEGTKQEFFTSLKEYIFDQEEKPHVVTLNYDKLLYGGFSGVGIFGDKERGLPPCLIDGFLGAPVTWQPKNCASNNQNAGWYISLHGSPLFQTKGAGIEKLNIAGMENRKLREEEYKNAINHLILTDPHFKEEMINKSEVLKFYWGKFKCILSECERLVVIGYAGKDPHVNELIRENQSDMDIVVVEWDFGGNTTWFKRDKRELYWKAKFGKNEIKYKHVPNILDIKIPDVWQKK